MPEVPPLGPVSYALGSLTPENFERLCWRLVRLQYPSVRIPDNPDGGADALLPAGDGKTYERAWQAKRYTSNIQWAKCKESLDRAVATYGVRHVTFCFARNLTGPQEKSFQKHLAERHDGVKVDWIGADELHALLTESEPGEAVARFFFGAPFDDKEALERAIALGGRLETPEDALAHLRYVEKLFAHKDPYFRVDSYATEAGAPAPTAPDTVMSWVEERDGISSRLDIAPRDDEALRLFGPEFSIGFTDDDAGRRAQEAFDAALKHGVGTRIEGGVRMVFDRAPRFLEQIVGKELLPDVIEMSPSEAVGVAPATWLADLSVVGRPDITSVPIDLQREPPPDGWDTCFRGKSGGMEVQILSRWREDRGELNLRLRHQRDDSPARAQVASLRLLRSLSAGGRLVVADRSGVRPPLQLTPSEPETFDARSLQLLAFLEDVVVIEDRTGLQFALPDDLDQEGYMRVRETARALRSGEIAVEFSPIQQTVDADRLEMLTTGGRLVVTYPALTADILGETVHLRGFVALEPYEIRSVEAVRGSPGHSLVELGPPPGYDGGYSLKIEAVPPDELEQHIAAQASSNRPDPNRSS